ncbi:MAG: serine hydrolase domain-containing protein [Flavobacteriales bacterium]
MKTLPLLLIIMLGISCTNYIAQNPDMSAYNGDWQSIINPLSFSYQVEIKELANNAYQVSLNNHQSVFNEKISSATEGRITLSFLEVCNFSGEFNEDKSKIEGFLKIRDSMFHLSFSLTGENTYQGQWNSFYVDELNPAMIYLAMENGSGEDFEAYPIFPDNRYRGTYTDDFQKKGNNITFVDRRSGHSFIGELKEDTINMDIMLGKAKVSTVHFVRSNEDWKMGTQAESELKAILNPLDKNDGLKVGSIKDVTDHIFDLERMTDSIEVEALTNVHSVLIAHKGTLIYEKYFNGFNSDLPHDTRSAAKSIASATVGIAIDENIIDDVNTSIYSYIPEDYQYTRNDQNEKISLHHLLTMSSGLDAIDFGIERQGGATEEVYQQSDNWLKTVLEAPMLYEAGEHCNYGSANPYLLGIALAQKIDQPMEEYMDDKIFSPLGIVNYSKPKDDRGDVYLGGGSYLLPRDLMKFGLLYANGGNWKGQQLISEQWVDASFKNYRILENTTEKNGYGYLFWHDTYEVNGREINSVEARGAGGQIIAVIKELDLVIVINSGNYRNGRYWQPQIMIKEYILPCFVN